MTTWQEWEAELAGRLAAASPDERVVFAVGVAERLMRAEEALPAHEQAEYALGLRPMLNALWEAALGNPSGFGEIKHGLGEYLLSEYCHNDGQHGPGDADEPAAAAVLHTAVAYLFGAGESVSRVSSRAVEAADARLDADARLNAGDERANAGDSGSGDGDSGDGDGDSNAVDPDEVRTAEVRRQLRDLALIGQYGASLRHARLGLDIDTSARLHRALRVPLSSVEADA
ncbi:hypothetical protein [Streptomyces sp. NBC_00199]|uniref:hypothetical protein n=1 Tax=Streptomyces sp. NBC_00199 TaxID=2975678 RepID=UPI002257A180|nr:hypothetical protein [Streptomyces sp. NBC_00199]MCX5267219.1 hypothetical protein [Streptomyces sp. NBC_00199]